MDKPRPRAMDIRSTPRSATGAAPQLQQVSRRQLFLLGGVLVVLTAAMIGWLLFLHRNDQAILHDRYQAVYLVTGQIYIGKLQNRSGQYLTLTHVYTIQSQNGANKTTDNSSTDLVQVSRQVYGPDDSMAIRADQVQFWQNLRSDSKVAQAIASADK